MYSESYKATNSNKWRKQGQEGTKRNRIKQQVRQALKEAGINKRMLNNPLPYQPVTGELVEVPQPPKVDSEAKTTDVSTKNVKKKVNNFKLRGLTATEGLVLGGLGTLAVGNIVYKNLKNRKNRE